MNDDGTTDLPDDMPDDGMADDALDRDTDRALGAAGDELRRSARPVDGHEVIGAALRTTAAKARRNSVVLGAVAVVAVVALVGTMIARSDVSDGSEVARAGLDEDSFDAASSIVDDLPPEPIDPHDVQLVASVSRYDTCDALLEQLRTVGAAHIGSRGFGNQMVAFQGLPSTGDGDASMTTRATTGTPQSGAADSSAPSGGGETLGTNVIVAGVDEPDTVKAVGSLVVELHGNTLRIIDTASAEIVGNLGFGDPATDLETAIYQQSLLVDGDRVVVFGSQSIPAEPTPGDPSAATPAISYLTITFVDISDPTSPAVTDRARIEGRLVSARRVDGQVRVVTSSSLEDLPIVLPTTPNSVAPALAQNRLAVASSSVDDWIPQWDHGESTDAQPLVRCDGVEVPDTFAGVEMTSLVAFDLAGPFEPRATSLLAPSGDLTATATDVVIGSQVWVDPIDQGPDFSDWSTALHRFTFEGDAPHYIASGAVDGSIRDDFSMSVLDDEALAVVTSDVLPWDSEDRADVTVRILQTDTGNASLTEVGSLVPESSGEGVAGLRFVGDRLLLSTGFAGNTLSIVDLTDRSAPRETGTVSLPGSGGYIHPTEDNRALVVGETIRKEGDRFISGSHVTDLDLSAAPRVAASWSQDNTSIPVPYDHHAFTWWPRQSLAAFPLQHVGALVSPPPQAAFLTIGTDVITARFVTPREADLGPKCEPLQQDRTNCDDSGVPQVDRVLVVNGAPWVHTSESLEGLDPSTLAPTAMVNLPPTR